MVSRDFLKLKQKGIKLLNITAEFLETNPNCIFVFGDNTIREGKGGAAMLRDYPNTYGFITKKLPDNKDTSFYRPEEYFDIYYKEVGKLAEAIKDHVNKDKIWIITPLGAGLANKYNIFEKVIQHSIKEFLSFKNIIWLF